MDLLTRQKQERQERILAAARDLIERVGYEGVTIRDLARESGVSVPTLYKFFGDKDRLLMKAVEDKFLAVMQAIAQDPSVRGLDLLLAILQGCCREVLRTSSYSKEVIAVFVSSGRTSAIMNMVGRDLVESHEAALDQMVLNGELAKWANTRALAERLTAHQNMVCIEWESGNLTNKALHPTMAYGACMMVLGVAEGKAARRLGKLVRELQDTANGRRAGRRK
jgi:AcrR family transcriptional regulator